MRAENRPTSTTLKEARKRSLLPLRVAADLALDNTRLAEGNSRYGTFSHLQSKVGTGNPRVDERFQGALARLQEHEVDFGVLRGLARSPEAIRKIRFCLDLTLPEFGVLLGKKSQLTVINWEQGRTRMSGSCWTRLIRMLDEDPRDLLIRAYGSAAEIPRRRRGSRFTVARMKSPSRKGTDTPYITGPRLKSIRTSAYLSLSSVAALAFGTENLDIEHAKALLLRFERNKKVSAADAASVLGAIEAALKSRRAVPLTKVERCAENLRGLRDLFDFTQLELAALMCPAPTKRGLVCAYESGVAPIPTKRFATLVRKLAALEKSVGPGVDAALAELAGYLAGHQKAGDGDAI